MQITDFDTLTFDCYGTLIDWESGIADDLRGWALDHGVEQSRDELLEAYGEVEYAVEHETPGLIYPEVLRRSHYALQDRFGTKRDDLAAAAFSRSVPNWPAFPDTADALRYLKQHYRLVILSNVDRASFAGSNRKLGVKFDLICTAQDIGTYKPDPGNFDYLLKACRDQLGKAKASILHTAQSVTHDIVPGRKAGMTTCWIDRRKSQGWGATKPPPEEGRPDFVFHSIGEFAARHAQLKVG